MLLHQQSQIQLKNCPADLIQFNYQAPLMDIKTVGYKSYHLGSMKKKPHSPVYNKKKKHNFYNYSWNWSQKIKDYISEIFFTEHFKSSVFTWENICNYYFKNNDDDFFGRFLMIIGVTISRANRLTVSSYWHCNPFWLPLPRNRNRKFQLTTISLLHFLINQTPH